MSQHHAEPRDSEQRLDDTEETQAQHVATQATMQEALRQQNEQFLERLRDIDIKGEGGQDILNELGVEFSGVFAIANEDEDDYRRHKWLNLNKAERLRASRNPGRLCRGPIKQVALGIQRRPEATPGMTLSPREHRAIKEAMEARTAFNSLGRGSEGLKAVSEVTAVTEHRRQTDAEDNSSSGILGRVLGR